MGHSRQPVLSPSSYVVVSLLFFFVPVLEKNLDLHLMKMQISFLIEKNLDLYLMEDAKQFF